MVNVVVISDPHDDDESNIQHESNRTLSAGNIIIHSSDSVDVVAVAAWPIGMH